MDKTYYDFTAKMETAGVDDEYIQGWQMGYLNMPDREQQRTTDVWSAGKKDGAARSMDNYTNYIR